MEQEPPSFRELYEALWSPQETWYTEVLPGWMPQAREALAALEPFRKRNTISNPYPILTTDQEEMQQRRKKPELIDVWDLVAWYAISRVSDWLLTLSPHPKALTHLRERQEYCQRYSEYFAELGFTVYRDWPFHPFYHEIVEVQQESSLVPGEVVLDYVYWPGLMFGEMVFARSGVRVLCAPGTLHPWMAESSVLYFTHMREHRKTSDLADGWGHNSQWRTAFRRDYAEDGIFYFNVDGKYPLNENYVNSLPDRDRQYLDDLTLDERIELLIHRCFVTCTKDIAPDSMLRYPFNDTFLLLQTAPWYK